MAAKSPSHVRTLPPPLGGINGRDDWRNVPAGDALSLVNWVVRRHGLEMRRGYATRNTGVTGGAIALMRAGDAYFAATQTAIWNITDSGSAVSAVTGLTGGRWSWDSFANGAGVGLVATNGTDGPRYFLNGNWGTCAISGVEPSGLVFVVMHGRRPMFVRNGALEVWYLPVNAIGGEARRIDLGPLLLKGGEIASIASHSPNAGRNIQAMFYVVTTRGELVVYAGHDPNSTASWSLVGVYDVPPPVGRDCFCKIGSKLAYLSRNGLLSIPDLLSTSPADEQKVAITSKLGRVFDDAIADAEDDGNPYPYTFDMTTTTMDRTIGWSMDFDGDASPGTEETWCVFEAATDNLVVINRTRTGGNRQFVMDPDVSGWTEWAGIPATAWIDTGREIWFATAAGTICRYTGVTDNGAAIDSLQVEPYRRSNGRTDGRSRVKPIFENPPTYRPRLKVVTDFASLPTTSFASSTQAYQPAYQEIPGRGADAALALAIKSSRGATYLGRDTIKA